MSFSVFIPARFGSSRFPGKPLIDLAGKTMIQRVYERASQSSAKAVIVATDDERIVAEVERFQGQVMMTSADHQSGTDRIHEAAAKLGLGDDEVIVNVQGDEPLIPPKAIDQVASLIKAPARMATLMEAIEAAEQIFDPNIVKAVADDSGRALYFSRAPIPWSRSKFQDEQNNLTVDGYYRHLGIYAYQMSLLNEYVTWPVASLEQTEALEQLRVLANGEAIQIAVTETEIPPGIDSPEDVGKVIAVLAGET